MLMVWITNLSSTMHQLLFVHVRIADNQLENFATAKASLHLLRVTLSGLQLGVAQEEL